MPLNPFDDRSDRLRAKAGVIYALLLVANGGAWIWAWIALNEQPALLATALLAYTFGLRHAFDADHIAAIDNVVRKLMQDGTRPYSVGLFFSLGHSTIVLLVSVAIAATATALQGRLEALREVGAGIGTSISSTFLIVVGLANLFTLQRIWVAFVGARRGEPILDEELNKLLAGRGLLARCIAPLFRIVSRSWHMYPIGLLFGLGFDTATEIGLLGISASQAAQGMSVWTTLLFPALFTASMSLVDTTDSVLMTGAYTWAFVEPVRKLWYNLTITATSVTVALFIGGVEALGLISGNLDLSGGVGSAFGRLNDHLTIFGAAVVCIFVTTWIISMLLYRTKGYDAVETPRA